MKTTSFKLVAKSFGVMALVTLGASAMAASTWNFSSCTAGTAQGTGCIGKDNTTNFDVNNNVKLSAWANTGASSTFAAATLATSSAFRVEAANENTGSPQHAMDNSGNLELIAFNFASAIALDQIQLSWTQNDADITVMAYTGGGTPTTFIGGKTAAGMVSGGAGSGWTLIENSGDVDVPAANTTCTSSNASAFTCVDQMNKTRSVNAANVTSSWWLISAYSSSYGAGSLDSVKDFVKILSLSSKDLGSDVPEPGSLALLGLGLVGLLTARRRNQ